MFNILTGGKVTLALSIIIFLLITTFSLTVAYYTAEIKTLKADIKEKELQSILYKDSLAQANKAIEKQNKAYEQMKLETSALQAMLEQESNETERLRQAQIDRAELSLSLNNSCETKLAIIKRTQEGYLNGKK